MEHKIILNLTTCDKYTLINTLQEEIDRNGDEYPDINQTMENVLQQLT